MEELTHNPTAPSGEYFPGALGEFITPVEKSQLATGVLGKELIEIAYYRTKPVELPPELEALVIASRPSSAYLDN